MNFPAGKRGLAILRVDKFLAPGLAVLIMVLRFSPERARPIERA
jgi:hypothetical protein